VHAQRIHSREGTIKERGRWQCDILRATSCLEHIQERVEVLRGIRCGDFLNKRRVIWIFKSSKIVRTQLHGSSELNGQCRRKGISGQAQTSSEI
jgi:hypothetical protein